MDEEEAREYTKAYRNASSEGWGKNKARWYAEGVVEGNRKYDSEEEVRRYAERYVIKRVYEEAYRKARLEGMDEEEAKFQAEFAAGVGEWKGLDHAFRAPSDKVVMDEEEARWHAGWPNSFRTSGIRVFVVDQGAEVVAASNDGAAGRGLPIPTLRQSPASLVPWLDINGPLGPVAAFRSPGDTGTSFMTP